MYRATSRNIQTDRRTDGQTDDVTRVDCYRLHATNVERVKQAASDGYQEIRQLLCIVFLSEANWGLITAVTGVAMGAWVLRSTLRPRTVFILRRK